MKMDKTEHHVPTSLPTKAVQHLLIWCFAVLLKLVARWLCQLLMTSLKYQLSSPLGLQTAFTGSHFFLFFPRFFWHFLWQNSWPFEVMVVILSVTAYVGAKPVVEKAQKFDAMKKWYVSKVWPSALPQRIGHGSWSRFYRWPAGVYRMNGRKQKKPHQPPHVHDHDVVWFGSRNRIV